MATHLIFLQLAPEFGGTKFGPFDAVEIRLGSDQSINDICLPEQLGVASQHCKVLKQSDQSWIIAPIERGAAVYLWREGHRKPKQITAPVAIAAGDGFSLVTPEGPRFILVIQQRKEAALEEAQGAQSRKPTKYQGILKEFKRVGLAKAMTTGIGHWANNTWRFVKTGQLFSPVYIVAGMGMMSGMMMGAGGGGMAWFQYSGHQQTKVQLQDCQDESQLMGSQNNAQQGIDISGQPLFLTQQVLGDRKWRDTLREDKEIKDAFFENIDMVFSEKSSYEWVYTSSSSDFMLWKNALEQQGMHPALVRVFAYAAATPGNLTSRQWHYVVADSRNNEACGRGPLGLTYAQAKRLQLSASPDALVGPEVLDLDRENWKSLVQETMRRAGETGTIQNTPLISDPVDGTTSKFCLHYKDDEANDQRTDVIAIAQALRNIAGANAFNLPTPNDNNWLLSRMVKFYMTDFNRDLFDAAAFPKDKHPSLFLGQEKGVRGEAKSFALNRVARLLARSVAIPCMAMMADPDGKPNERLPKQPEGTLEFRHCLMVAGLIDYDKFH